MEPKKSDEPLAEPSTEIPLQTVQSAISEVKAGVTPSKLLITETIFHVANLAIVAHALINGGNIRDAVITGSLLSILGRTAPTELVDRVLNIKISKD